MGAGGGCIEAKGAREIEKPPRGQAELTRWSLEWSHYPANFYSNNGRPLWRRPRPWGAPPRGYVKKRRSSSTHSGLTYFVKSIRYFPPRSIAFFHCLFALCLYRRIGGGAVRRGGASRPPRRPRRRHLFQTFPEAVSSLLLLLGALFAFVFYWEALGAF